MSTFDERADFVGWVLGLVHRRLSLADEPLEQALAAVDVEVRTCAGGRDVYVARRAKRLRLHAAQSVGADASANEIAAAAGVTPRHARSVRRTAW